MRYLTIMFWVIAGVAALFAFSEVAPPAAGLARGIGLVAAAAGLISIAHDLKTQRRHAWIAR